MLGSRSTTLKTRATQPRMWSEFAEGPQGWDVVLNTTMFHHHGLLVDYARAYHEAAKRLFGSFRQTDDYREMDAHPIVFLYRHALEVYLKTVIDIGNNLLYLRDKPAKNWGQHNLATLLSSVREIFDLIDCSDMWKPPTFRSFSDVERVVLEVNKVPHDAFRYPVDPTGTKELLPDSLLFNMSTFADKLDALLELLNAAAWRTYDTFQAEVKAHMPS